MRTTRPAHIASVLAVVGVALAAPAHADDDGYLEYLHNRGYTGTHVMGTPVVGQSDANTIAQGHSICNRIHHGETPGSIISIASGIPEQVLLVEAAQHEICPDTLGGAMPPTPVAAPTPVSAPTPVGAPTAVGAPEPAPEPALAGE